MNERPEDRDGESRITSGLKTAEEASAETGLRPKTLDEYVGQEAVKKNLGISIKAALGRKEALDHVLLYGPPGLGKTTLANVIARELGVGITGTSGPALERPAELAAILTNLRENDILFIDEIHRLNRIVEETLYPAMEDFQIDIIIGEGPGARTIKLDVPRFTLIGATTRAALLTSPLRDRFGIVHRLEFYTEDELRIIAGRSARLLRSPLDEEAALELARRSRGTPRVTNRLLRRARDYAQVEGDGRVTIEAARDCLGLLDIDERGLEKMDRGLLRAIIENFGGGPVGIEPIAAMLSEEADTINDVYEPYLVKLGFILRTPRGRVATKAAHEHLGLTYDRPEGKASLTLDLWKDGEREGEKE